MNEQKNEDIAVGFLELVIDGKIDEAYRNYMAPSGKHHNLYTAAGFEALKKGMQEAEVQYPNKQFSVKKVIAAGDLVAVYSHLIIEPGDPGMAVVHMFQIVDGKIIEMWDCAQKIPEDSPNSDGAF